MLSKPRLHGGAVLEYYQFLTATAHLPGAKKADAHEAAEEEQRQYDRFLKAARSEVPMRD